MSKDFRYYRWQTSKENRLCNVCGRIIHAGDKHAYGTGKILGRLMTSRVHQRCLKPGTVVHTSRDAHTKRASRRGKMVSA